MSKYGQGAEVTLPLQILAQHRFVSKRLAEAMAQNPKAAWLMYYAYGVKSVRAQAEAVVEIKGNLYLGGTRIQSLGNLKSVDGYLYLGGTQVKDLGNLQSVGGSLDLGGTQVKDLGNLQSVGGDLGLRGAPIKNLGNVKVTGSVMGRKDFPVLS